MVVVAFNGFNDRQLRGGDEVAGAKRKEEDADTTSKLRQRLEASGNECQLQQKAAMVTGSSSSGSGSSTCSGSVGRPLQW